MSQVNLLSHKRVETFLRFSNVAVEQSLFKKMQKRCFFLKNESSEAHVISVETVKVLCWKNYSANVIFCEKSTKLMLFLTLSFCFCRL
jgi:hypothetical protein